jgi:hypothetical protein
MLAKIYKILTKIFALKGGIYLGIFLFLSYKIIQTTQ